MYPSSLKKRGRHAAGELWDDLTDSPSPSPSRVREGLGEGMCGVQTRLAVPRILSYFPFTGTDFSMTCKSYPALDGLYQIGDEYALSCDFNSVPGNNFAPYRMASNTTQRGVGISRTRR